MKALVAELRALQDTYLGGRSRLRYTTFGELFESAARGFDIPVRSVLEIEHNIRQQAFDLVTRLTGDAAMAARVTEVGNPHNLEALRPGEHMLQDAFRMGFSSMFDSKLKRSARELQDRFLQPFSNLSDAAVRELTATLQNQLVDGRLPARLLEEARGDSGEKIARALYELNNEILVRGLPYPLLPAP
jgi:hypothetical protein